MCKSNVKKSRKHRCLLGRAIPTHSHAILPATRLLVLYIYTCILTRLFRHNRRQFVSQTFPGRGRQLSFNDGIPYSAIICFVIEIPYCMCETIGIATLPQVPKKNDTWTRVCATIGPMYTYVYNPLTPPPALAAAPGWQFC